MYEARAHVGAVRRRRWRSYLLLSRVSNLPTIGSNVLAGIVASSAVVDWPGYVWVTLAIALFYTGGMFLNDAFDEPFDRRARPERPIPNGDVSRGEVFVVGAVFLLIGELLLFGRNAALFFGAALAAAIVIYDYSHKGNRFAPIVMGLCRGLVYCVASAAAAGAVTRAAFVGAAIVTAYVAGLTVVAKLAGSNARWLIPVLIAGISLVDAVFIASVTSSLALSLAAAIGFVLTLFLQRFVPGD